MGVSSQLSFEFRPFVITTQLLFKPNPFVLLEQILELVERIVKAFSITLPGFLDGLLLCRCPQNLVKWCSSAFVVVCCGAWVCMADLFLTVVVVRILLSREFSAVRLLSFPVPELWS